MQIVSDVDKTRITFKTAPPRERIESELSRFFNWFNSSLNDTTLDPFIRELCTLIVFTVPPEDGNGRITRLITDLALRKSMPEAIRFYAMSVAIF